ncbi:hypothetical protein ACTU6U_04115 [Microbacterium sp. A196]|uniref:hypothetical protein n=1 Tax=unclassified Microbacterium TaxID=2609290 RepID=UPI003FD0E73D
MGLFSQNPADKDAWAALPGEPLDRNGSVDDLPEVPVDPLEIGLGLEASTSVSSISVPVALPAPEEHDAPEEHA